MYSYFCLKSVMYPYPAAFGSLQYCSTASNAGAWKQGYPSLVPRPNLALRDKIWEWPGNEAKATPYLMAGNFRETDESSFFCGQ